MRNWLISGINCAQIALFSLTLLFATQADAQDSPLHYVFTPGDFTSFGGTVSSGSLIAGSFDYDAASNTTSNANFTVLINGVMYNITGSAPVFNDTYLVFTNNIAAGAPVVLVLKSNLPASGYTRNTFVMAGYCVVMGDTCSRSDYAYANRYLTNEGVPNTAPVANAGPDQTVASSAVVTLTGSASSDADSDPLTYSWSQVSGASVTLSDATSAQPTFAAPTLAVGDPDATLVCPSSEFFGMLRRFRNGGSGSVSV